MIQASLRNLSMAIATALAVALLGCSSGGTSNPSSNRPAGSHDHDHDHDHADHDHADHDHADHGHGHAAVPQDFSAAVAVLQQHYHAIRDGFESDDLDGAHHPLHEVGHVLEALPALAVEAGLPAPEQASVEAAVAVMLDAYGQIDGAMHQGKTPDYPAVATKLDQAMADINQALPSPPQDAAATEAVEQGEAP